MAILSPPIYNPSAISNPIEFITQVANPNPLLYALAELFVNGVAVSTIQVPPFQSGGGVYLFKIDFRAVCSQLTAPIAQTKSSIFGNSLNSAYTVSNSDNHANLGLIVTYFEEDPVTGKPSNTGIFDLVPFDVYEVLNATRQRREDLSLDAYTIAPREPYTNQPQPYDICNEESLFLTIPPIVVNSIQVETFDASGALLTSNQIAKPIQFNQIPYTIGVGPTQLNDLGFTDVLAPLCASYTVTGGLSFGGPFFVPLTRPQEYTKVNCCEEKTLRVHFINKLGGGDAFSFTAKKTELQETKSGRGQIPLPWDYTQTPPSNIYDRGAFKIDTISKEVWEVESKIYNKETGSWLSELYDSPETYLETPQGLLPCIVRDKSLKISETDGLLTATATIEIAVNKALQTY